MEEARQRREEALRIAVAGPADPEAYVRFGHDVERLRGASIRPNRMEEGRQHFEDSLKTFRRLADQNPEISCLMWPRR